MYQQFYGLRELPFELTPNPRYLFLTSQHREALTTLEYGLFSAKGLTALIGEAGTGKTTLIHAALESERCRNVTCVYINNPALTRQEFIETLSLRFGLSSRAGGSKALLIGELEPLLRERRARGLITALVVDEAQSLSNDVLEEIRLLANSETTTEKLLPFVLAGQPELRDRLNEPGLRQLKQRVTLRCEIRPFTQQETAAYIEQRIRTAGGEAGRLFTREAVMLIHDRSGGIPRTISVICDNALLTGLGLGRTTIDSSVILEVARDFDLPSRMMFHSHAGLGTEFAIPAEPPAAEVAPQVSVPEVADDSALPAAAPLSPAVVVATPGEATPQTTTPRLQERPPAAAPQSARPEKTTVDEPELFAASSQRSRRFSIFGGR
jgi:general secretion pathway protein A